MICHVDEYIFNISIYSIKTKNQKKKYKKKHVSPKLIEKENYVQL